MPRRPFRFDREALITGALGAGAVALWFLVRDLVAGVPGRTPSILGQVLLFGATEPVVDRVVLLPTILYTLMHFAAFALIGALLSWLIEGAEHQRVFWVALVQLVVVVEVLFVGVLQLFASGTAGLFPVWTVLVANALALTVMLLYVFRHHPMVLRIFMREVREGEYIEERAP